MKNINLEAVRANIDRVDDEIIKLIAERGTYAAQALAFKKNEESVKDTGRVEKVIAKVKSKAEEYGAMSSKDLITFSQSIDDLD